jgi:hypothetical protein
MEKPQATDKLEPIPGVNISAIAEMPTPWYASPSNIALAGILFATWAARRLGMEQEMIDMIITLLVGVPLTRNNTRKARVGKALKAIAGTVALLLLAGCATISVKWNCPGGVEEHLEDTKTTVKCLPDGRTVEMEHPIKAAP